MGRAEGANRPVVVRRGHTAGIAAPRRLVSRIRVPFAQHAVSPQLVSSCGIEFVSQVARPLPGLALGPRTFSARLV